MSFPARYTTPCDDCYTIIRPGDDVEYNNLAEVVHVECPDPIPPLEVAAGEISCSRCWLIHPEGECDR